MREFYLLFKEKINDVWLRWELLILCIISYGFVITNFSWGIDDTALDSYLASNFLQQGRWVNTIIYKMMGLNNSLPVVYNVLGCVTLSLAAIAFIVLVEVIVNKKIDRFISYIFCALFITFSLGGAENYVYDPLLMSSAISFLLVIVAMYFTHKKSLKSIIISSGIMYIALSISEIPAIMYLVLLFCIIQIEVIQCKFDSLQKWFLAILPRVIPLVVGCLFYLLFNRMIPAFLGCGGAGAYRKIWWGTEPVSQTVARLVKHLYLYYVINAIESPAVRLLLVMIISGIIVSFVMTIKNKNVYIIVTELCLILSSFSLGIIMGDAPLYRWGPAFNLLVAFHGAWFVYLMKNQNLKKIAYVLVGIVSIRQATYMTECFYTDYCSNIEEENAIIQMGYDLARDFAIDTKPVVFVGTVPASTNIKERTCFKRDTWKYNLSVKMMLGQDYIHGDDPVYGYKYTQRIGDSVMNWGTYAFGPNGELIHLFQLTGFDLKKGTYEMIDEAEEIMIDQPAFPKKGYIQESDECIMVKLGDYELQ